MPSQTLSSSKTPSHINTSWGPTAISRQVDTPSNNKIYSNIRNTRISAMDSDDKIKMGHNNIHIQPVNNGFIITILSRETGISVNICLTFDDVLKFLSGLSIMDIDSETVADNV